MLNNKLISIGVIAVIVLAIVYLGNLAMKTTPQGGALGQTQYKVVPAWDATDIQGGNTNLYQAVEIQLNKYAKEGWELVEVSNAPGGQGLILKK